MNIQELADRIAFNLNGQDVQPWGVADVTNLNIRYKGNPEEYAYLISSEGHVIRLEHDDKNARITVSGVKPLSREDETEFPYNFESWQEAVRISTKKTPAQIAAEIRRRFLESFLRDSRAALECRDEHDDYLRRQRRLAAEIACMIDGTVSESGGVVNTHPDSKVSARKIQINGANVDLEISLSPEHAKKLFEMLIGEQPSQPLTPHETEMAFFLGLGANEYLHLKSLAEKTRDASHRYLETGLQRYENTYNYTFNNLNSFVRAFGFVTVVESGTPYLVRRDDKAKKRLVIF